MVICLLAEGFAFWLALTDVRAELILTYGFFCSDVGQEK